MSVSRSIVLAVLLAAVPCAAQEDDRPLLPPPPPPGPKLLPLKPIPKTAAEMEALVMRRTPAAYPEAARAQNVSGAVVIEVTLSRQGRIEATKLVSGPPLLRAAALTAVRKWQFRQTVVNGRPLPVIGPVTVVVKP